MSVSRLIVGLVFAASSLGKWLNLRWFATVVAHYALVPRAAVPFVAVFFALTEAVLAVSLLIGWWQPLTAVAAFGLIAIFTLAVLTNLLRGRNDLECGCALGRNEKVSWHGVGRNVGLMGLALIAGRIIPDSPFLASWSAFILCLGLLLWPSHRRVRDKTANDSLTATPV
jgi:hypothetical protein